MCPSLAGGIWGVGASAHKAFSGPIRLLPEVEHVWRWFPALAITSAQGAGGSPDPPCSYGEQWARGETRMCCFPEQTRIGAQVGFPRRVSLSRIQLLEGSFVPFLRWALAVSFPTCQRVGCWGQGIQGLFRPHPPSPQRRARLELVSSSSDDLQSTSAQRARGSPDPPWP